MQEAENKTRERFYEQLWEAYDQASKQAKDDIAKDKDKYSQGYKRPEPEITEDDV